MNAERDLRIVLILILYDAYKFELKSIVYYIMQVLTKRTHALFACYV